MLLKKNTKQIKFQFLSSSLSFQIMPKFHVGRSTQITLHTVLRKRWKKERRDLKQRQPCLGRGSVWRNITIGGIAFTARAQLTECVTVCRAWHGEHGATLARRWGILFVSVWSFLARRIEYCTRRQANGNTLHFCFILAICCFSSFFSQSPCVNFLFCYLLCTYCLFIASFFNSNEDSEKDPELNLIDKKIQNLIRIENICKGICAGFNVQNNLKDEEVQTSLWANQNRLEGKEMKQTEKCICFNRDR